MGGVGHDDVSLGGRVPSSSPGNELRSHYGCDVISILLLKYATRARFGRREFREPSCGASACSGGYEGTVGLGIGPSAPRCCCCCIFAHLARVPLAISASVQKLVA